MAEAKKFLSKNARRRRQLLELSKTNIKTTDMLLDEIKRLHDKNEYEDASPLLDVARELLDTTKKLNHIIDDMEAN